MRSYLFLLLICSFFFGCEKSNQNEKSAIPSKSETALQDEIFNEKITEMADSLYANLSVKNYFITKKIPPRNLDNCLITSTLYIRFNLMPNEGVIEYYIQNKYEELSRYKINCKEKEETLKRINLYANSDDLKESILSFAKIAHEDSDESKNVNIKATVNTSNDGKYSLSTNGKNVISFDTDSMLANDSSVIKSTAFSTSEFSYYDNLNTELEIEDVTDSFSNNPFVAIINIQVMNLNKYRN